MKGPPADIPLHQLPDLQFLASEQGLAFGDPAASHRIDFYALIWFTENGGEHFIDFESFPVQKDTVFLLAPNQVHAMPGAALPQARVMVFSPRFFQRIEEPSLRRLFLPFRKEGIVIPDSLRQPLRTLFDLVLLESGQYGDSTLLLHYIHAFLQHLERLYDARNLTGEDQRIGQLLQLLQDHYKEEKNTAFYARQIGLSPKRLNEILKDKMDTTVSGLLYHLLLIEAKRELYHDRRSVKEVAYELGFSDPSYFARFFKKRTGLGPEAFRTRARSTFGAPAFK